MSISVRVVVLLSLILVGCSKSDIDQGERVLSEIRYPIDFDAIQFPSDNEFTPERWLMGKKLFYDTRLSRTGEVSCASCHKPELAFSDNVSVTPGVEGRIGKRNAPSLANIGYAPYFMREGAVQSLEAQVLVPAQDHAEFDFNIVLIIERLKSDAAYQNMSLSTYGDSLSVYSLTRAISTFERSLISGNSRYDAFLHTMDEQLLSVEERMGYTLFFSEEVGCVNCHSGFNFTNYAFENNGLYAEFADKGKYRLTHAEDDIGKFKVPSLRNVGVTYPYMHDGSVWSLREVIEHYNAGGKEHVNQSPMIKPLNLTEVEMDALVAFLHTLTDYNFLENEYLAE